MKTIACGRYFCDIYTQYCDQVFSSCFDCDDLCLKARGDSSPRGSNPSDGYRVMDSCRRRCPYFQNAVKVDNLQTTLSFGVPQMGNIQGNESSYSEVILGVIIFGLLLMIVSGVVAFIVCRYKGRRRNEQRKAEDAEPGKPLVEHKQEPLDQINDKEVDVPQNDRDNEIKAPIATHMIMQETNAPTKDKDIAKFPGTAVPDRDG